MDNPDFSGNVFRKIQTLYTRCITIFFCKYLIPQPSMSEVEHRVFYFIKKFCLSISATCSRADMVLTSSRPTLYLTFSNYISIRTRLVKNTPLAYNFVVFVRYLANCPVVLVGTYLQVINLIFHDKVDRNGIPCTNMTSAVKVTNFCS